MHSKNDTPWQGWVFALFMWGSFIWHYGWFQFFWKWGILLLVPILYFAIYGLVILCKDPEKYREWMIKERPENRK